MTKNQNQPYCFKSGKDYISMGKITENVTKISEFWCQILEKWHYGDCCWPKILKQGVFFWPNFLKQVVTEIQKWNTPVKIFKVYPPGPGGLFSKLT